MGTLMTRFDTPRPLSTRIDVAGGAVRVRASERSDTVVHVRPGNPGSGSDVQAAEQTRVDLSGDTLRISTPRRPRLLFFAGSSASVEVDVELPAGSSVEIDCAAGDVDCGGPLGDVRVICKYGDVRVERARSLRAETSAGDVHVGTVDRRAEAATAYGSIRVADAGGDLRADTSCGDVAVERARGSVDARTRYGAVRVGCLERGAATLETAYGSVEAAVRRGTVAWLDVHAPCGRVRNLLTASGEPDGSEQTVEIRARTAYGDVLVRRA
jgi:ethanolamine utilization microcompartment shell protein EutS